MAQLSTSTTNFNQTVVALVQKRLEELLRAPLPHLIPGNFLKAEFIQGTNNTMRFINIPDLAVTAGTPTPGTPPWLTEGVPPTSEDLPMGYEEFSANQAGRLIKITDKALLQNPFDLIAVASDRVARNAIAVADKRVAEILITGTNVLYANNGGSSAAVTPGSILTGTLVKKAVALLASASVPRFADGTYHAIVHPGGTYDLESDTTVGGWIDAQRYAGSAALFTGEVGRYAGVRFIESAVAGVKTDTGLGAGLPTVTATAATDLVNSTAHGLVAGNKVQFQTLTGGAGLVINTTYYVIAPVTANTFKVSATPGGTAIDITTDATVATAKQVVNVNSTTIFGPESYAFGDWGSIEVHMTPPGGHDDPLKQSALVGWKGYFGAMIVGEGANATNVSGPRYIRIESAASL